MSSSGPYRLATSSRVELEQRQPIVLEGESPSPTKLLEVVDYSDASIAVAVYRPYPRAKMLGRIAIMLVLAGIVLPAIWYRLWLADLYEMYCVILYAIGSLAVSLRRLHRTAGVTREFGLASSGFAHRWERGGGDRSFFGNYDEEVVPLPDVETFDHQPGWDLVMKGRHGTQLLVSPSMALPLDDDDLEWLAGRLRRALARLRADHH